MNHLFKALVKKLEGEIEIAKANCLVYQRNSVGIGEHPDVIEAMDSQIAIMVENQDKRDAVQAILDNMDKT